MAQEMVDFERANTVISQERSNYLSDGQTSNQAVALVFLRELEKVERTDLKPYCIELVTRDRTYYLSLKSDEELYAWMDEIYLVFYW